MSRKQFMSFLYRRRAAALGYLLLGLAVSASYGRPAMAHLFGATPAGPTISLTSVADGQRQVLVAYCTPHGLEPDETVLSPGQYSLMVRNRSGVDSLSFTIELVGQAPVFLGTVNAGQNIYDLDVPLAPGEYIVRETSHPEWQSHVTITP